MDDGVVDGGLRDVEYIEFSKTSGQPHGGHLDFHYAGNTTADYTSRIIEDANGRLSINSAYFNSNGNVGFGTTPHQTHRVNVSGSIQFDGNILTKSSIYPELASAGNELVFTLPVASQGEMHINWRGSSMSGYVAPNAWTIHAGTGSSYAALKIGSLTAKGNAAIEGNATIGTSTTDITHYIQIGGARLYWDEDANSLYVQKYNGAPCNFYSLGGIAALGATSGSGGLTELTLGQLNVTGDGVLFDDGDGVSKIYSSGGMLTFECEEDFVFGSSIDMSNCDISNASSINASSISAGSAKIQSSYVYLNTWSRLFATTVEGTRTVYLQIKNSSTNNWDIKGTWN